jgi:hypothetical protein
MKRRRIDGSLHNRDTPNTFSLLNFYTLLPPLLSPSNLFYPSYVSRDTKKHKERRKKKSLQTLNTHPNPNILNT